ncbi:hypothetical protein KAR91_23665 [Candidatus Pacearchaeota archaeon]|nr:hypothetical protein [Candidatus Pacearchaeota archaeon]
MFDGPTIKWQRKVRDFCDSQYQKIEVTPGEINCYSKCQLVATHYAIKNKHKKLALGIYRNGTNLLPMVHFLNHDGNEFIDNSIGHWCKNHEYRFIRWVDEKEFFDTPTILTDTKRFFSDMASGFAKKFGNVGN